VTVTIEPAPGSGTISTGLERLEGQLRTFFASDFDVLYGSPILVGNQRILTFHARGVPHELVGNELGAIDSLKVVSDLARMVEAAADLMGELPYRRYVFMHIGRGGGGQEHANSTAIAFDPSELDSAEVYRDWLSFICHEYFHLYNVKRIRPLALGPFDYDGENYTHMLWVSEGFTVYHEDLILNRAGLLTREQCLEELGKNIAKARTSRGTSCSPRPRRASTHGSTATSGAGTRTTRRSPTTTRALRSGLCLISLSGTSRRTRSPSTT
jgi:predicted metalloprotease with PDZ domain